MKKILLISFLNLFICLVGLNFAKSQELKNEVNFTEHSYILGYGIRKRKIPQMFQGNKKRKKYFEGWYFKMVSADGSAVISVIPGISLSRSGEEQHAFIQIIDGKTANTFYYTYPIKDFHFSEKGFFVRIDNNYFSEDSIYIDIQNDTTSIKGVVYMSDQTYLTQNKKKKGVMGWFRFMPFMQCYHGVVSLTHTLKGTLTKDNEIYIFDNGVGYIEKDWGKSMPSSWIWMQSNSFNSEKTSFMLSVASVPYLGASFTGFLGFFVHDSTIHRFGTYTRAKLQMKTSNPDTMKIIISNKEYIYHIKTHRNKSGILKAPVNGSMDRHISESIDAKLKLTVMHKTGNVLFQDSTSMAGLELVGNVKALGRSGK